MEEPEMDVETVKLQGILEKIVTKGMATGDFEDPTLVKGLEDFFRNQPRPESFNARKKIKKDEKTRKRNFYVKGLPSFSSSDSYENDFLENVERISDRPDAKGYDPNGKSSEAYKPQEPDDTPIYDTIIDDSQATDQYETSAEEAMMEKFSNLCLERKQTILDKERLDELNEIEESLKGMPNLNQSIRKPCWRSLFVHTNQSEFVTESDITTLLDSYQETLDRCLG